MAGLASRLPDLQRYAFTIRSLHSTDVSQDADYQRRFNGLYGVRRNQNWRTIFYDLMERQKSDRNIDFSEVLTAIFEKTGRVEASFSSKLIATINPDRAIYDSIIRRNLALPNRGGAANDRIKSAAIDYAVIQQQLSTMVSARQFQALRKGFDEKFPQFTSFSDMKALDFMIWQMR